MFWDIDQTTCHKDLSRCLQLLTPHLEPLGITCTVVPYTRSNGDWTLSVQVTRHGQPLTEFVLGWVDVRGLNWYLKYPIRAGQPPNPRGFSFERPHFRYYPGLERLKRELKLTIMDARVKTLQR